ncbi:hypothetical protein [Phytohabitans houttuyneae]|nr:hypothetical protein [Phytohabitans houttuyneae]
MSRTVPQTGAAVAVSVGIAGLVAVGYGLILRFHIENTDEAIADEARGGLWLLAAAGLLTLAATAAGVARAPWWAVTLIPIPIVAGILPALLLPANILPFGTAMLSVPATLTGLITTIVCAFRRG